MWDERLTTVQAEKALIELDVSRAKRRVKRDAMAAEIMLQSYLDFLNEEGLSYLLLCLVKRYDNLTPSQDIIHCSHMCEVCIWIQFMNAHISIPNNKPVLKEILKETF